MSSLRILITNIQLCSRSGTELYVYDLARAMLRHGHTPIVYSPRLGEIAERLADASVPVVDSLDAVTELPHVIHGHHSLETMAALLHFPNVPAVFVCHDCSVWYDTPPNFPRIGRYVAVDYTCRDRLTLRHGISSDRVDVLFNAVDLKRFQRRGPLPDRPRRALLISNYADYRTLGPIREACKKAGVVLDVVGANLGGVCDQPEVKLRGYDLVFCKGRCAWEALAVGAAVIVCDASGVGPMVTCAALDDLKKRNFGRRLLQEPLRCDVVLSQIVRYDAQDATEVCRRIRASAGIDVLLDQLVNLYRDVIHELERTPVNAQEELRAAAAFVHWWAVKRQELIRLQARRYRPAAVMARLWHSLRKRLMLVSPRFH